MSIRIGILGYGNLGRGVESAIAHNEDMELVGVFTRRNPENVKVRTGSLRRKRDGSAGSDPQICSGLQRCRQL